MIQIFLLFLLGCVVAGERSKRIPFGTPVTQSQLRQSYSFMVFVRICDRSRCALNTGTLVKRNRVLTAAHSFCWKKFGSVAIYIYANGSHMTGGRPMKGFRLASKPPAFNCAKKETTLQPGLDIALIAIYESSIHSTDGMKPVPLLCKRPSPGQSVTMLGYGYDEQHAFGYLRSATGKTIPCPQNTAAWRKQTAICIGLREKTPQPTVGDYGGPLLLKHEGKLVQIGVASGYDDLIYGHHGFYCLMEWASVAPYCKWIQTENTPDKIA